MTWLLSPLAIGLLGALASAFAAWRRKNRLALGLCLVAVGWLWLWSSPWVYLVVGGALERCYPPCPVEALPKADAIVVLGGGIGSPVPQKTFYPELFPAADRGWHAARCFHAGKAPVILFSGVQEGPGMRQFLIDLGVPPAKIILESESKNTYENGLFTTQKLTAVGAKRVILVTSAWHLRRAVMTFQRMGLEIIPAGTDYEALLTAATQTPWMLRTYLPTPDTLYRNSVMVKEYLGYWAYGIYLYWKGMV